MQDLWRGDGTFTGIMFSGSVLALISREALCVADRVSALWSDMSSERRALLEKAYPEVLAFCRSLGLVFEVCFPLLL